jgi:hypothetical protein
MLKNTLKRGAIGALIGMVAGILISCIFVILGKGGGTIISERIMAICGDEAHALLLTMLLSGIMGFVDCAGMTFYEMENWSLFRIMASHLAVIFASFLPVAFFLDWVETLPDVLLVSGMMLVGYFIVYLIMCTIYRRRVSELNILQKKRAEEEKDKAA